MTHILKLKLTTLFVALTIQATPLLISSAFAEEYYWHPNLRPKVQAASPLAVYEKYLESYMQESPGVILQNYGCTKSTENAYLCKWTYRFDAGLTGGSSLYIWRQGDHCASGTNYDKTSGACISDKGWTENPDCSPSVMQGNPINISNGNKFQQEIDIKREGSGRISLARYYNSADGLWIHSYSTHLIISDVSIVLFLGDGRSLAYQRNGNIVTPIGKSAGTLKKVNDKWTYYAPNRTIYTFHENGMLAGEATPSTLISVQYKEGEMVVMDALGNTLTILEDENHQLRKAIQGRLQELSATGLLN